MASGSAPVCVVIAAYNADATIERAVASALGEPEVGEVIVVDDASRDGTCEKAASADDGTGRLKLVRSQTNRGPAAARNRAFDASACPFVSILDADDFFVGGRFGRLLASDDWDLIADNIVFTGPDHVEAMGPVRQFEERPRFLRAGEFVEGNISRRGRRRGETGFLKPVIRRSFLLAHGLRYREDLRLGEDYELYTRALIHGARYKVLRNCGYVAVERPDSLSGRHRTEDLRRLCEADRALSALPGLGAEAERALARHAAQLRGKFAHRRFLDSKRAAGPAAAVRQAFADPRTLPAIAGGILSDKLDGLSGRAGGAAASAVPPAPRYLFAPSD